MLSGGGSVGLDLRIFYIKLFSCENFPILLTCYQQIPVTLDYIQLPESLDEIQNNRFLMILTHTCIMYHQKYLRHKFLFNLKPKPRCGSHFQTFTHRCYCKCTKPPYRGTLVVWTSCYYCSWNNVMTSSCSWTMTSWPPSHSTAIGHSISYS